MKHLQIIFGFLAYIALAGQLSANEPQNSEKKEHKHETQESHEETRGDHGDEDDHDEKEEGHDEHADEQGHGDKHTDEHGHGDKHTDEHGHGDKHDEEENSQVGPGKGIVSASENEGIQISPQAEKNFEIQRVKVPIQIQFDLPKSAIVTAGTEVKLYRYREGHYKRIDFDLVAKSNGKVTVKSKELKAGDEVVVYGTGLLRIAEIAAFGGAPEGHSH
jgi:hypothetical protein